MSNILKEKKGYIFYEEKPKILLKALVTKIIKL